MSVIKQNKIFKPTWKRFIFEFERRDQVQFAMNVKHTEHYMPSNCNQESC